MFETGTVFILRTTANFEASESHAVIKSFHNRIFAPQGLYPWVSTDE